MSAVKKLVLAGAVAFLVSPANATLIVTAGNTGGGHNTLSIPSCTGLTNGPATTITGCLNNDHTIRVRLDSADENIEFASPGQAKVIPSAGPGMDDLKISLISHTFTKLVLNIEAENNGTVSFSDNFGDISALFPLSGAGNNFFTLSGDTFSFISFASSDTHYPGPHGGFDDGDVNDVKQIRFFGGPDIGPDPAGIPEPSTIALLGFGLLGLGFLQRRRQRVYAAAL